MQIALIADLHGNRPATEALERDLSQIKPDKIFCLGDIVGKGPSSDFTFDWAISHCDIVLGGNWDFGVGRKMFAPDAFYWQQLGDERMRALCALPLEYAFWFSGRHIRLFHGRPIMDDLISCNADAAVLEPFFKAPDGSRYDVVGYADAHRQSMRTLSPGVWFNTGSVGNAMGVPKCCYAIFCGEEGSAPAPFEIRFRQLDYNKEQAVRDALQTPLVPRIDAYINEVKTGVYSRKQG